ncbi:hypothetical protein [Streptomyces dysideae]|uniref:DUF5666 domain-containing protein n=1 Tax=Streptomyces dysideae TaxID=909626 RepID=A0A101UVT1_9ACTN|nr:hypothetical protein [Streptomyces dysideae]KUO17791.1 hypothetical protein AQJ91_29265 [Streptomyces dysideae]
MTHEPDQERSTDTDMEVLTAPGGPDRASALGGLWRRQSVRARTVTAAATVAVLALGGTVAYAATSQGSGEGASPSASGSASPAPDGKGGRHGHGMWFGLGGDAAHGEATVKDPDSGDWVVRIWQRGTVEKTDGDQVTVKSEDDAEWTWTVGSDTKVNGDGAAADIKEGDTAYLVGTLSDDDTRTAARVFSGNLDEKEDKGPGGWRDRFPGHGYGHRDGRDTDPSANTSGSGTAT